MHMDKVAGLWATYRRTGVNATIHDADHMWATNPKIDDYNAVGESGVRVISSVLAASPKESVWRIMDFGSGHGRVARHIRAMFPQAQMFFADIDEIAIRFCAEQLDGIAVTSQEDLTRLILPQGIDLIWVGSVFTHIDYARMEILFDALFDSLGPGGILIATFRGRRMYEITKAKADQAQLFAPLLEEYETSGAGYQSYDRVDLGDWGLSLTSLQKIVELGGRHSNARLVALSEAAWANVHDVGSWMKL